MGDRVGETFLGPVRAAVKRFGLLTEKSRFILVGAINTCLAYVVFALLYLLLRNVLHYLVIATLSHFIAVAISFTSQRRLVFRHQGPLLTTFFRFNVATSLSLLFGLAGMMLLVDGVGLPPLIGQAIVTAVSVVIMYVMHRYYTFRNTGR